MSSAKIRRVESIETFQRVLLGYTEGLGQSLDELGVSVRRLQSTFEDDFPAYWIAQLRDAEQQLTEAENEYARRRAAVRAADRPAATEALQRVSVAKQRRRLCRSKLDRASRLAKSISRETERLLGPIAAARLISETDLPAASADLKDILSKIHDYLERDQREG